MTLGGILLVLVAGLWAGAINTIVGSGTLVTFPALVALGVPPVTATMSNAMGLIAGNVTGAWGYRSKLEGVRGTLLKLVPWSLAGGLAGAWLLLHLPATVFETVSPVLIGVALVFVLAQPRLQRAVARRREGRDPSESSDRQPAALYALVLFAGLYGGYFVAAQGVLLLGILGVFLLAPLQSANAVKTVLVAVVNLVAALFYVLTAADRIDWLVVLLIAASSTVGSLVGARIGMRLRPGVLRAIIVLLGLAAIAKMVLLD